MKIKILLLFFLALSGLSLAQKEYPLVTIQDIQRVPDSLAGTDPASLLNGDTVRVRGVVMVSPFINPDTARRNIIVAGSRWVTYVQDPNGELWGGINILQENVDGESMNTFFDVVDTAQVVEFTGRVVEYNTTTEILLIDKPPIAVQILDNLPKRPEPIQLQLSDLFTETGVYNFDAEKYEGMLVEFKNVITSDRNPTGSTQFKINDGHGHFAFIYNQSRYFKTGTAGEVGWTPPNDGSYLSYVRGIVTTRTDGYYIVPVYPGDVGAQLVAPPTISAIKRDASTVGYNQPVKVSAKITDFDGTVAKAYVHYRVNGGVRDSVEMTSADSIFTGTIPGVADSATVDYYITATDNGGSTSINPSDTTKQNYYYFVLNRPLTIRDIQFNPKGGSYTAYYGYPVTVSGVVTADTAGSWFRTGTTANRVIIQDGKGPWTGVWLSALNTVKDVYALKTGDNVTVTGVMTEDYDVSKIDSISSLVINSRGNAIPEPQVLTTGDIGKKALSDTTAERWESVLVTYKNVKVTDLNADGDAGPVTYNYGEIFINDGTGDTRVELQDGNHYYNNVWEGVDTSNAYFTSITDTGSTFESLTGYLYYSHSYYKLVPRYQSDFIGFGKPTSVEHVNTMPASYAISQNYPNPFNPSTIISYSIPKEGHVVVKVYNIIGQEVATLVNAQQTAGTYKVSFDASSLSTGVYFYRISSGSFNQVRKMMLIK
jgi:DNA/RNA endonuclease YhcR with UshA esterase domain